MGNLKKNLKNLHESNPNLELFFFDEARFGTHSKLGHGWFVKGSRTPVKCKLGFQNFYLYGAVNPMNGEDFTLMLPTVNTESMNTYLSLMSAHLEDRKILLIMDQAGWHKAKGLIVPHNITILYLPPYCPELNPVERLWKYIKQNTIKNRIYDTLEALEISIMEFFKSLTLPVMTSLCNITYL